MKKLLLLFVVILITKISFSQENTWIFCGKNSYGDSLFIKNSYISKKDNVIKLWGRVIYPNNMKNGYKELLQITEYDCYNHLQRSGHYWVYGKNKRCVLNADSDVKGWQQIVPDTFYEKAMNIICSLFNTKENK